MYELVTPAKATEGSAEPGVQEMNLRRYWLCIPHGQIPAPQEYFLRGAFAEMTGVSDFMGPNH